MTELTWKRDHGTYTATTEKGDKFRIKKNGKKWELMYLLKTDIEYGNITFKTLYNDFKTLKDAKMEADLTTLTI